VTLLIGSASGGVWKSEDGGTSFHPVFDKQPVKSIGAVALDPTNGQVMWAGSGESWTRNSVSVGNGVYKSTDGGETWTNMGLPNVERITRIVVHPRNGNIVYACAPGALWSDSPDRGLYKTIDGGRTWTLILKGLNLSTGCSSVAMDPANPEHLLAGTWDFRRKPYEYRSGGDGPDKPSGSRFAESRDGGRTWKFLDATTRKGLPNYPWGRLEIAFAPSNPKQIYAFIENPRPALFVSENGGLSWQERDRSQGMVWRPFYFGRIVVDPKDPDRLFKMGFSITASEDGGKSFCNAAGGSHGDCHDIWINPANTKNIVGGDDGGLWHSYDGANRWWKANNLPVSQFYHVSTDNKDPYQVYGGLQDNSSWVGDSEYPGGITNNRWENLFGGDGFWAWADPSDPNFAYAEAQGGHIGRVNRKTLQARDIQPKGGYKEKLRYNWTNVTRNVGMGAGNWISWVEASRFDPAVAYVTNDRHAYGDMGTYLYRTTDYGRTWHPLAMPGTPGVRGYAHVIKEDRLNPN